MVFALRESTLITDATRDGTTRTTRKPILELVGRPIPLEELPTLRELFSKKCKYIDDTQNYYGRLFVRVIYFFFSH